MFSLPIRTSRQRLVAGTLALTLIAALGALLVFQEIPHVRRPVSTAEDLRGPPWVYGHPGARFELVEYADLECPYCRDYFVVLRRWISRHPDVYWEWHHLPLSSHEPAASAEARLAECAGEIGGNQAFWSAVEWIYRNTRGNGEGLPADAQVPHMSARLQECVRSPRVKGLIHEAVDAAINAQITATPTLRLVDRHTGKMLVLPGVVEEDALSSAIDLLVSAPAQVSDAATHPDQ